MKGVLDEDRRLTCDEVAESVGISHGSAPEIITRHLKNEMDCHKVGAALPDARSNARKGMAC